MALYTEESINFVRQRKVTQKHLTLDLLAVYIMYYTLTTLILNRKKSELLARIEQCSSHSKNTRKLNEKQEIGLIRCGGANMRRLIMLGMGYIQAYTLMTQYNKLL